MKCIIDSNIIIENYKSNQKAVDIIQYLSDNNFIIYVNPVVISEVTYILIKKKKKKIQTLKNELLEFNILNINKRILEIAFLFMEKYKLMPNDAIILASCSKHNIKNLASLDTDFIIPCRQENINLINKVE